MISGEAMGPAFNRPFLEEWDDGSYHLGRLEVGAPWTFSSSVKVSKR